MTPYRTIVMDPPWRYTKAGAINRLPTNGRGPGASAEAHYPTLTTEEIAGLLPIDDLAARDASLYVWVTNPVLLHQRAGTMGDLRVTDMIRGWGFEPMALLTWHKLGPLGMGWYFRGDTEHVIYATRGKVSIPAPARLSNHFAAQKGRHSVKPDRFFEIVEQVSPGPYLEVFARRRRFGWDAWGNEAPVEAASQAPLFSEKVSA